MYLSHILRWSPNPTAPQRFSGKRKSPWQSIFRLGNSREFKKYDENPVRAVSTFSEPSGRDRFTTAEEILRLLQKCDQEKDTELKVFVTIAATTGLRKGAILPRKYTEVFLEEEIPFI